MSCLGLEGNLQGNPCRFALTSRGPEGGIQRYVLQASDPAVSQAWIKQVAQILESQRDFLNGEAPINPLCSRLTKPFDLRKPPPPWTKSQPLVLCAWHFFPPPSTQHPLKSPKHFTLANLGGQANGRKGEETGGLACLSCNTSLFFALFQHCSHPLSTRDGRARPTAWGGQEGLG